MTRGSMTGAGPTMSPTNSASFLTGAADTLRKGICLATTTAIVWLGVCRGSRALARIPAEQNKRTAKAVLFYWDQPKPLTQKDPSEKRADGGACGSRSSQSDRAHHRTALKPAELELRLE